jgi:spore maturation protein CgeB
MRILVIGGFHFGSLTESYARAFEMQDHEVFRFDSDRAYFQAAQWAGNRLVRRVGRRLLWNRVNLSTIEAVRCVRPKLVLVVKGSYLHPETVRRIRTQEGIPVVNYYSDNPYCGIPWDPRKTSAQRRDLVDVLKEYSVVFIWGNHLVKQLRADGVTAKYLPFGVDPELYRPFPRKSCEECGQLHGVVFVGQWNKKRQSHIRAVRHHQVGIWGPMWVHAVRKFNGKHTIHNQRVFGRACAAIYSSSVASLNVVDDLNMPGHNMRTFEIPASGGIMISTFTAEQAEFFPEGEAAWYYRDQFEIDEILDRILEDREEQERFRKTALNLASDHTYNRRAEDLLKNLK